MNAPACRCRHAGYALLVTVLLLVGASVAAAAMLRASILEEGIARNVRDKQRAFEAAQAALRYGETWLQSAGGPGAGGACSGTASASALVVCSTPLSTAPCLINAVGKLGDPSSWPARFEFVPAAMEVETGGGLAQSGDVKYAGKPGLYVEFAGASPGGGQLYCITAYGYGGAVGTLAIVRSLVQVQSQVINLNPNAR